MVLRHLLPLFLVGPTLITAMKTSIYINEIPLYSRLPPCVMERMSAIVRAQSSGCGDDRQLTSFSCFCIDQSSKMSSIISTAVEASCAAIATATVTSSGPPPEVTSAIELFDSYCAKSTDLSLYTYQDDRPTATITITNAPTSQSSSATTTTSTISTAAKSSNTVPIAAIAAPVVIGVVAIAAVVGVLFYFRRKRRAKNVGSNHEMPPQHGSNPYYGGELASDPPAVGELSNSATKYRHELENREIAQPLELDGRGGGGEKYLDGKK